MINLSKNEIKNENEKEKENYKDTLTKNKIKQNDINIINHMIEMKNSIKNLYKSAPRSRFSFVKQDNESNQYSQIIPSQLNDFITQLFVKHSIFFSQEQNNLSLYYFALKPTYLDSNDSFSSLISTLKRWNDNNELKETDMINRFNTY